MAKSDLFVRQHQTLRDAASRLQTSLDAAALGRDATEARSALSALAGALRVHLANEDKNLYPSLASASDPKLQTLARRFQDEMGGLAGAFRAYADQWPSPAAIQAAPAAFVTASKDVLRALAERMQREERDLYPQLDAA